jgi:hypothetical protein
MALIRAIARTDPDAIEAAIWENPDGTITVRLFEPKQPVFLVGRPSGRVIEIRMSPELPVRVDDPTRPAYAHVDRGGAAWPGYLERALAAVNGHGYASLNEGGGGPHIVGFLSEITGKVAFADVDIHHQVYETAATWRELLDAGSPIIVGTKEGLKNPKFRLFSKHAYEIVDVVNNHVILKNPHGRNHPDPVPLSEWSDHFNGVYASIVPPEAGQPHVAPSATGGADGPSSDNFSATSGHPSGRNDGVHPGSASPGADPPPPPRPDSAAALGDPGHAATGDHGAASASFDGNGGPPARPAHDATPLGADHGNVHGGDFASQQAPADPGKAHGGPPTVGDQASPAGTRQTGTDATVGSAHSSNHEAESPLANNGGSAVPENPIDRAINQPTLTEAAAARDPATATSQAAGGDDGQAVTHPGQTSAADTSFPGGDTHFTDRSPSLGDTSVVPQGIVSSDGERVGDAGGQPVNRIDLAINRSDPALDEGALDPEVLTNSRWTSDAAGITNGADGGDARPGQVGPGDRAGSPGGNEPADGQGGEPPSRAGDAPADGRGSSTLDLRAGGRHRGPGDGQGGDLASRGGDAPADERGRATLNLRAGGRHRGPADGRPGDAPADGRGSRTRDLPPIDSHHKLGDDRGSRTPDPQSGSRHQAAEPPLPRHVRQMAEFRESLSAARADLKQRLDMAMVSGKPELSRPGDGKMAETAKAVFPDGSEWIVKRYSNINKADAEFLTSLVSDAVGAGAPMVIVTDTGEIWMPFVKGELAIDALTGPGADDMLYKLSLPYATTGRGLRIGIMDDISNNDDRNPTNWVIDPSGEPVPFDHGENDYASRGNVPVDDQSPFASPARLSSWRLKSLSWRDWAVMQRNLDALEPIFAARNREGWYANMMSNFAALRAKAGR